MISTGVMKISPDLCIWKVRPKAVKAPQGAAKLDDTGLSPNPSTATAKNTASQCTDLEIQKANKHEHVFILSNIHRYVK